MAGRIPAPLVLEPKWGTGGLVCPQEGEAPCGVGTVPERVPGPAVFFLGEWMGRGQWQ